MGTSYSHFREALRKGHAREASDLYHSKKSLRDSVLPNHPLGCGQEDNTALHFAAKFGLKDMYVDLINRGGKPDQKNKLGKNCLHLICGQPGKQRTHMLRFTLEAGLYGMDLAHVLEEKDEVRIGRGEPFYWGHGWMKVLFVCLHRMEIQSYTWQQVVACKSVWR